MVHYILKLIYCLQLMLSITTIYKKFVYYVELLKNQIMDTWTQIS